MTASWRCSPPPGTSLIPTNLLAPLRTLYPQLARDVVNLTLIQDIAEQLSTSVVQRLGIAAGQTNENANTVRAIVARIAPVLKSQMATWPRRVFLPAAGRQTWGSRAF